MVSWRAPPQGWAGADFLSVRTQAEEVSRRMPMPQHPGDLVLGGGWGAGTSRLAAVVCLGVDGRRCRCCCLGGGGIGLGERSGPLGGHFDGGDGIAPAGSTMDARLL